MLGVALMFGVIDGVAFDGVSSHRDRRLLELGVDASMMPSLCTRSAFGVSAQPLLCPGVSLSVFGVSSHRLRRVDFSCAGVSWPGVAMACAGVASHMRVL